MDIVIAVESTTLRLRRGDITEEDVDCIVNAANSSLMGGGGVDGAIHRVGGPQILEECRAIRKAHGECPTGEAVLTSGGRLRARYVLHTVGPVWQGGTSDEDHLLRNAYNNCLRIAAERGLSSIAFPSISTGVYGFPIERAARIAFDAVCKFIHGHHEIREVRFIVFSDNDFQVYRGLFQL